MSKNRLSGIFIWTGASAVLTAEVLLFYGASWVGTLFYLCAWWPFILLLDGLNFRLKGRSLLLSSPGRFLRLALVSVPWWLLFEAFNFRLENWSYVGVPGSLPVRWAGYSFSFASVLPGIFEVRDLLLSLEVFSWADSEKRIVFSEKWGKGFVFLGVLSLLLPVIWPGIFFPLVWGFVFLLLEPGLYREGPAASWWGSFCDGKRQWALSLLASGLLCGTLWEFWNFWAGAKWVYSIPWGGSPKLFEMPLLGYAGFLPFALECQSFHSWLERAWERSSLRTRAACAAILILFCLLIFLGMDSQTVLSLNSFVLQG